MKTKAFRTFAVAVVAGAVSSVFEGAGSGFGIITITGAVAVVAGASAGVAFVIAGAVARVGSVNTGAGVIAGVIAGVVAVAISLLSIYIAWRALKGDKKFALVWKIGVAFGAIGGTSFCGADLTNANFTKAILASTNFNHTKQNKTILHQVCWAEAKKLDRVLLGTSHS